MSDYCNISLCPTTAVAASLIIDVSYCNVSWFCASFASTRLLQMNNKNVQQELLVLLNITCCTDYEIITKTITPPETLLQLQWHMLHMFHTTQMILYQLQHVPKACITIHNKCSFHNSHCYLVSGEVLVIERMPATSLFHFCSPPSNGGFYILVSWLGTFSKHFWAYRFVSLSQFLVYKNSIFQGGY
jgi:hypothetical protein